MKGMLGAVLFAWSRSGPAQEAVNSTPTEVLEARAHYEAAIAAAERPIRERYLSELDQLLNTAYATKDFDLAQAVTQEISLMQTGNGADNGMSPEDRVIERMINTTWVWGNGQTITFLADGKARWSNDSAAAFTWKVGGAVPPVIEGKTSDGGKFWINLDAGLRSGNVVQGRQQRATSRIEFRF
jgi:predicted RNA-binding protein